MDNKTTPHPGANIKAIREGFYGRIDGDNLAPLWEARSGWVTPEPRPTAVAHRWHYSDIRPFLKEACQLITAEEAERRVLILENPGLKGQSRITNSLFAG